MTRARIDQARKADVQAWLDDRLTAWARAFLGQLGPELVRDLTEIEVRRPGGGEEFLRTMGGYVARHARPVVASTLAALQVQDGNAPLVIEIEEVLS